MEKHLEMRSFMVQPIVNLTKDHVNMAINGMSKGDRKYRTKSSDLCVLAGVLRPRDMISSAAKPSLAI